MQITILAVGSRGDVQPAVALGAGLRQAGHAVRIGSYAQFAELVTSYGLAFTPIAGDIQALLQSEEGRAVLESRNPLRLLQLIRTHANQSADAAWADISAACAGADALVSLGMFYYAADAVATVRQLPHLNAQLQPNLPTSAFPAPLLPALPLRTPFLNRASHQLAELLYWHGLRSLVNRVRQELGLARLPLAPTRATNVGRGTTMLLAYSSLLVPRPADWPATAHITGFWYLDAPPGYTPPPALVEFLKAGEPPVYIGFGSMNTRNPQHTGNLALQALRLSGRRGLLLRGWGGLAADAVPPDVMLIDDLPHAWLFPQLTAAVHHGGAGTTGAVLRAGVPAVTVPFFADQPFWAARVAGLGVAPAPLPRRQLSAEALARAIEVAATAEVRERAAALGPRIAGEDGVGQAVTLIERVLGSPTAPWRSDTAGAAPRWMPQNND